MEIRAAHPDDWSSIWPFMREIARDGRTFSWDQDIDEERARDRWFPGGRGRTVVAVDEGGQVLGTAESGPNHEGPASHVATASFMVDPASAGRGVGRALGRHVVDQATADGFRAMQFNAVVESNTRAVALWKSLGFRVLTTVPEAFHHPDDGFVGLHIMFRTLGDPGD